MPSESTLIDPPTGWNKAFDHADICEHATMVLAWEVSGPRAVEWVIFQPCNSWECGQCGPRKRWELITRIEAGRPERLITLTCRPLNSRPDPDDPDCWISDESPQDCWKRLTGKTNNFWTVMRKRFGPSEYCRVLEQTKRGYPHWHYLQRGAFLPIRAVSESWNRIAGSPIVDLQFVANARQARSYATKYVCKADRCNLTRQRVAFSRSFSPKPPKPETSEFVFTGHDYVKYDPSSRLSEILGSSRTLRQVTKNTFTIADRTDAGDDLPDPVASWLEKTS